MVEVAEEALAKPTTVVTVVTAQEVDSPVAVAVAAIVAVQGFPSHFKKTLLKEFAGTIAILDPKQLIVAVTKIHQNLVSFQWTTPKCS